MEWVGKVERVGKDGGKKKPRCRGREGLETEPWLYLSPVPAVPLEPKIKIIFFPAAAAAVAAS